VISLKDSTTKKLKNILKIRYFFFLFPSNHFNKKGTQALNSPTNYKRIKKDIKICFHNSTTTEEADKNPCVLLL